MKHKAKRTESGYTYRGYEIERRESVPSGFSGAWVVYGTINIECATLKACKAKIDILKGCDL